MQHPELPSPDNSGAVDSGALPLRILVAEDNPVNQKVADRILARIGHRADLVANGREALEALAHSDYDVVFMDMQMPEMDGLEATRGIRAEIPAERQPRIVAMTANVLPVDRQRCLAAGMDDFVSKPVRVDEMRAALARNVRRRPAPAAPPPGAPEPEPSGEPLDLEAWAGLLVVSDGDPTILRELVDLFTNDGRALVESLGAAITRADAPECARLAHSLKGSSGNLGARRLAPLCAALEKSAKGGDLTGATALHARIGVEFEIAAAALMAAFVHVAQPAVSAWRPAP